MSRTLNVVNTKLSARTSNMAKRKRRYYANNWRMIKDTDPQHLPQLSFEQFYEFTLCNWLIPSSHDCVIRYTNLRTQKVKEKAYKYRGAAMNFIEKYYMTHEFAIADMDGLHHLHPNYEAKDKSNQDKDTDGIS